MDLEPKTITAVSSELWAAKRESKDVIDRISRVNGRQAVDASSICRLSKSAFEIDLIVAKLVYLLDCAMKSQKEHERCLGPIIEKLSKGIATLPDELLSVIFQFAVHAGGVQGAKQAVLLSLVSRRFRQAALEEPNLWTVLRSSAPKEAFETILARSGKVTGLRAFVHVAPQEHALDMNNFMNTMGTTSSRWKALYLTECSQTGFGKLNKGRTRLRNSFAVDMAEFLKYRAQDEPFPHLQELNLMGYWAGMTRDAIAWICPSLHTLRCSDYIPSPSVAFSSVGYFRFESSIDGIVHHNEESANALFAFLTSLPRLFDFRLELDRMDPHWRPPYCFNPFSEFVCPNITYFNLRLFQQFKFKIPEQQQKMWYIEAFLEALRMPHLADLSISIDVQNIGETELERTELLRDLSRAILPSHLADPTTHLASLNYKITCNGDLVRDRNSKPSHLLQFPTTFSIPLHRIPTVSVLTITSCTRISFEREDKGELDTSGENEPCRLREVRFLGCDDLDIKDFRAAIQSLKDTGVWDSIERVSVEFCPFLEYDEMLEVVGKERLRTFSYSRFANPTPPRLSAQPTVPTIPSEPQVTLPVDDGKTVDMEEEAQEGAFVELQVPVKRRQRAKPMPRTPAGPSRIATTNRFSALDNDDTD